MDGWSPQNKTGDDKEESEEAENLCHYVKTLPRPGAFQNTESISRSRRSESRSRPSESRSRSRPSQSIERVGGQNGTHLTDANYNKNIKKSGNKRNQTAPLRTKSDQEKASKKVSIKTGPQDVNRKSENPFQTDVSNSEKDLPSAKISITEESATLYDAEKEEEPAECDLKPADELKDISQECSEAVSENITVKPSAVMPTELMEAMSDVFGGLKIEKTPKNDISDVDALFADVEMEIRRDFRPNQVSSQVGRLYSELLYLRRNIMHTRQQLDRREEELQELLTASRNDPRVFKMLRIAENWRHDKDAAEKENQELRDHAEYLEIEVNTLNANIQSMHQTMRLLAINNENKEVELKNTKSSMMEVKEDLKKVKNETVVVHKWKTQLMKKLDTRTRKMTRANDTWSMSTVDELTQKVKMLQTKLDRLASQRYQLTFERDRLQKLYETQIKLTEERALSIFEQNDTLVRLRKQFNDVKDISGKMQTEINRYVENVKWKTRQVKACEAKCSTFLGNIKELEKDKHMQYAKMKELEKALNNAHKLLREHERKSVIMDRAKTRLTMAALDKKEEAEIARIGLKHATDEIHNQRSQLLLSHKKEIGMKKQIEEEKETALLLLHRSEGLIKALDRCSTHLVNCQKASNDVHALNNELRNELTEFRQISENQVKQIKNTEGKVNTLQNQMIVLDTSLTKYQDLARELTKKNICLSSEAFIRLEESRVLQGHLLQTSKEIKSAFLTIENNDEELRTKKTIITKLQSDLSHIDIINAEQKKKMQAAIEELRIERLEVKAALLSIRDLNAQLNKAALRERTIIQQRDLLAARVIQANIELKLQAMTIQKQEEVCDSGKMQLRQLLNDNSILKKEITNLRFHMKNTKKMNENVDILRTELVKKERALVLEKTKNKALEEMIPTRVTRLRTVQASEPSHYELILKSHRLVRCLIKKTDLVVSLEEKNILLQRSVLAMKTLLASRNDPNLSTAMTSSRADLRAKDNQIKSLKAELNMTRDDLKLQKKHVARLTQEYGQAYFAAKAKDTNANRHKQKKLPALMPKPPPMTTLKKTVSKRRIGGGFDMSKQPTPWIAPTPPSNYENSTVPAESQIQKLPLTVSSQCSITSRYSLSIPSEFEYGSYSHRTTMSLEPIDENTSENNRARTGKNDKTLDKRKVKFVIPPIRLDIDIDNDVGGSFSEHGSDEEELVAIMSAGSTGNAPTTNGQSDHISTEESMLAEVGMDACNALCSSPKWLVGHSLEEDNTGEQYSDITTVCESVGQEDLADLTSLQSDNGVQ